MAVQAQETALKDMLEGKRQFAVPIYQRRYAWTDKDWQGFWIAVRRQYALVKEGGDALSRPTHFLGSLVVQPTSDQSSGLTTFDIIDGQQRLTTALILLIAIRDLWDSDEDKEGINESYLLNKRQSGDGRYKLFPGPQDRADLIALINGEPDQTIGSIGGAHRWFINEIQVLASESGPIDFDALERTVIGRLEIVDITLGPGDNAHRIFQTLNSTGRSLSQVDLLRNHFFMLLPHLADEAYQAYWRPMEELLGTATDHFLWVETVARANGREGIPRDRVYHQWQNDLTESEDDETRIFEIVKTLNRRAKVYHRIIEPANERDPSVRLRLERLKEWGSNVYHPLALQAMLAIADQPGELADALLYLESFMVRRLLTGTATNNLNRIFTTTAGQMSGSRQYRNDLRVKLSAKGKHWPSDSEIIAGALTEPFYLTQRAAQRQFILRRLEESLPGLEVPDWNASVYTIEHVMPQHATADWLEVLEKSDPNADPVLSHAEVVNTLGNLSLTTQNSQLSDRPLQRKQEILGTSILKMNREIQQAEVWNRETIESRSHRLAEAAISIWPGPVDDPDAIDEDSWQSTVRSTLAFLPDGRWTSAEDLAELTEQSERDILSYLTEAAPSGKDAVLLPDGRIDTRLPWVRNDVSAYRGLLVSRGILVDTQANVADQSSRLGPDSIASLQASDS